MKYLPVLLVLISSIIGALGSLYLKRGSKNFNRNIFKQMTNYTLLFGIFLYVISAFIFIYSLKFENVSMLYPLSSMTYIWISFLSIKYLGEKMNFYKWFGIFLIIVGVALITLHI